MRMKVIVTFLWIAGSMMFLFGCGNTAGQRSPEELLSLSYSGLAATDQYAFTGSMSIKTADGFEFKPQIFEGKVVDHKQLTLQTNSEDTLHWNPVQVLEALNESNEEVSLVNGSNDPETVTLHIAENQAASKERWEQRLRQELERLRENVSLEDRSYKDEWQKELERSEKQLNDMLKTMKAVTVYELVIDRDRLLPLKMDEKTVFSYTYNGKPLSEERHTTVRFQSFDGASSDTVQRTLSHVTMDLLTSDS
ncbi:hypothetical protein PAAL109150_01460 [Paenibacillus alkaliterrae]